MFRTIIVPVDLEQGSSWRKALPVAIDYARHAGARLHVLTVVPDRMLTMTVVVQLIPEGWEAKLVRNAENRLSHLLRSEVPEDTKVRKAVRLGSVYGEIMRYTREVDADLIIMSAHRTGAGGLTSWGPTLSRSCATPPARSGPSANRAAQASPAPGSSPDRSPLPPPEILISVNAAGCRMAPP